MNMDLCVLHCIKLLHFARPFMWMAGKCYKYIMHRQTLMDTLEKVAVDRYRYNSFSNSYSHPGIFNSKEQSIKDDSTPPDFWGTRTSGTYTYV